MIPRPREIALLLAPLALLPLALLALARREEGFRYPRKPERMLSLVVATPQWEGIRVEFEEGFQRWLYETRGLGVTIRWLDYGGGTKTLKWIQEQFGEPARDTIGVDVMFGGGTDPYEALMERGLLRPYRPPAALLAPERLPQALAGFPLYEREHHWFGTALTGFGIMINHRVLETIASLRGVTIRTWEDLARPELRGWVGAADPRSSSSYHTFFEILLQQRLGFAGFEEGMLLARRIGGNVNSYTRYSAEIPKLVALGQVAVAPTIDQHALAAIANVERIDSPVAKDALEFVLPEGRTLVNADAVAILKGAPDPEAAEAFVDFLLSDEAGRLWMLKEGEPGGPRVHPLNRATVLPKLFAAIESERPAATRVKQNPFEMQFDLHYDYAAASARWSLLNDLLGALLIDTQDELAGAVAAAQSLDGPRQAEALGHLRALPFTEAELPGLIAGWKDSGLRERKRVEWIDFARSHYRAAAALGQSAASGGVR